MRVGGGRESSRKTRGHFRFVTAMPIPHSHGTHLTAAYMKPSTSSSYATSFSKGLRWGALNGGQLKHTPSWQANQLIYV